MASMEPVKSEATSASHNTGFNEPFSDERNTTLSHPEASHEPGEVLDTRLIETPDKKKAIHKKLASRLGVRLDKAEAAMDGSVQYADGSDDGLQDGNGKHEGLIKRTVHKVEEKLHLRKPSS